MKEYGIGTLAYIDSFGGLIPCKVTDINPAGLTVKITVTKGGYKRGEIIKLHHRDRVVPRSSVYVSSGQYKIRNDYTWRVA